MDNNIWRGILIENTTLRKTNDEKIVNSSVKTLWKRNEFKDGYGEEENINPTNDYPKVETQE